MSESNRDTRNDEILRYIDDIRNPDLVGYKGQSNGWKLGYVRALTKVIKMIKETTDGDQSP